MDAMEIIMLMMIGTICSAMLMVVGEGVGLW